LPLMSDPESLATIDVLTKVSVPAFFTDPNLDYLTTFRAVNLSLELGRSAAIGHSARYGFPIRVQSRSDIFLAPCSADVLCFAPHILSL